MKKWWYGLGGLIGIGAVAGTAATVVACSDKNPTPSRESELKTKIAEVIKDRVNDQGILGFTIHLEGKEVNDRTPMTVSYLVHKELENRINAVYPQLIKSEEMFVFTQMPDADFYKNKTEYFTSKPGTKLCLINYKSGEVVVEFEQIIRLGIGY